MDNNVVLKRLIGIEEAEGDGDVIARLKDFGRRYDEERKRLENPDRLSAGDLGKLREEFEQFKKEYMSPKGPTGYQSFACFPRGHDLPPIQIYHKTTIEDAMREIMLVELGEKLAEVKKKRDEHFAKLTVELEEKRKLAEIEKKRAEIEKLRGLAVLLVLLLAIVIPQLLMR